MAVLKPFGRVALLLFVAGTAFATAARACECFSYDGSSCSGKYCWVTDDGMCACADSIS